MKIMNLTAWQWDVISLLVIVSGLFCFAVSIYRNRSPEHPVCIFFISLKEKLNAHKHWMHRRQ